ncbi:MAG: hypothetical protein AABM31_09145 [Actinomycetota bacterium]
MAAEESDRASACTFQPSEAKRRNRAVPMKPEPPVTKAVRSVLTPGNAT